MSWALLLLGGKRVLTGVATWLSHRSFWQLVCMALAGLLLIQHFQLADARHDRDAYKAQRDYYKSAIDDADKRVRAAQKAFDKLSADFRRLNDEENRRIAGDAQSLRVSGPGKATCHAPPAAASGHEEGRGKPDAPGPQVPSADSAAVPWPWLVTRAEQADLNRAEVLAWREWYRKLVEDWPK